MFSKNWPIGRAVRSAVLLLGSATMLSACQTTDMGRYQSAADSCSQYRAPLVQMLKTIEQPIAPGAVIGGALLGAAIGAIASGGKGSAIAVGAIGGALTGAAASYYSSRAKTARNQAELVSAIDSDAGTDSQRFSDIGNAMMSLSACRNKQISDLAVGIRSSQVPKQAALQQRSELQNYVKLDGELIDKLVGQVRGRSDVYVEARLEALRRAGETTPAVAANSGTQRSTMAANNVVQQADSAKRSTETNLKSLDALLS